MSYRFAAAAIRMLGAALVLTALAAQPASAQGIIDDWAKVQAPPPPALTAPTLDPKTTALLVLDIARQTCNPKTRPRCIAMLPRVKALLAHARQKGWLVVYSLGGASKPSDILAPVARLGTEPLVRSGPDKFVGTDLDSILKSHGIRTVVPVGAAAEGAVLETAASAAFRGFNVVVPVDGMASSSLYAEQYTAWDLVNAPLLAQRVKLSATDRIQ